MNDFPGRGFASDNCSGAHPEVLEAVAAANAGHAASYGADEITARLDEAMRAEFGPASACFPMLNGTGANVAAIRALARPHQAVICAETAHLHVDEAAAPEAIAGVKLKTVATPDGKLTPELVASQLVAAEEVPHFPWPAAVSIAQASEMGTVYTAEEVRALADFCHERGLLLHMDGARLMNAADSLGLGLGEISIGAGADALTLGGTKNGILFGEAVVFADRSLARGFDVLRKGSLQLASKMRFVSAQLEAVYVTDLGARNAANANDRAAQLEALVRELEGVHLAQPVEANLVFLALPEAVASDFLARCGPNPPHEMAFGGVSVVRLVSSWDTTPEDVEAVAGHLRRALAAAG